MKLTLLQPPGLKPTRGLQMHTPNLPIGMAYVASAARGAGHEVTVVDAVGEAPDRIARATFADGMFVQGLDTASIVDRIPGDTELVGVTCMFSSQWLVVRDLIAAVRERFPSLPIVCGGEHFSALPEFTLETSPADIVVLGEGEETIVELIAALSADSPLEEVAGITFRNPSGELHTTPAGSRTTAVDAIPWPAWDLFPVESYVERHQMHGVNRGRAMPVLGTRGCPFACTFCSSPQMWTQRWVARDPSLLLDEIEHLMRTYDAVDFHFQDLTAVIRKDWIIAFCQQIERRGLKISWQLPSGTRSEAIDREVAAHLFRAGCRNMAYAPESGSDVIRRIVKKQVKLDKMLESIEGSLLEGLSLSCFFVIGFPDDTHETLAETLKLVRQLAWHGLHDIGVAKFVPYPGSALFQQFLEEREIELNDDYFRSIDAYAESKNTRSFCRSLSARELSKWQLRLLTNFYGISLARYPWRGLRNVAKALITGREETRYTKMLRDVIRTRLRWRSRAGHSPSPAG